MLNEAPLESVARQMRYGFFVLGGILIFLFVYFYLSIKNIDRKLDSLSSNMNHIVERVDEFKSYDTHRISVLRSITSQYVICGSVAVIHYVQFKANNNETLSCGLTVAHQACPLETPNAPVLTCKDLDMAILPGCPKEGNIILCLYNTLFCCFHVHGL